MRRENYTAHRTRTLVFRDSLFVFLQEIFFFNDTATTEIYTLSLHDALPIWLGRIASVPPLRWLGPSVYGFIARHRYSLPGAPARCDTDSCAPPVPRPQ